MILKIPKINLSNLKFIISAFKVYFLAVMVGFILTSGCATKSKIITKPFLEDYPQLPRPNIVLNIPGLGPCNDNPNRSLHLNSDHPVNIFVHGCFGSAGRFRTLSEVFAFHGQQSVCFNYNDRDSMMHSSRQLADAVQELAENLITQHIIIMGHSQGGLVSRKALVSERDDPIKADAELQLVTVSAPFSGIRSARFCGKWFLRIGTLGIHDLVCWIVSGDKWHEITDASDFINNPGVLDRSVNRNLIIATNERDSCRHYLDSEQCLEDDFVFSLSEQALPPVNTNATTKKITVNAGHLEIVGEPGVAPVKLIKVLQKEGYLRPTENSRKTQFSNLLNRLYGASITSYSQLMTEN